MNNSIAISKNKNEVLHHSIILFICIFLAVALPQVLHYIGKISGTGKSLGVLFSPMHLPVMLAGFLAGPVAGLIAGVVSPVISSLLTGMPNGASLVFMFIELAGYGLSAGLIKNLRTFSVFKVFIVQTAGRVLRMISVFAAIYIFSKAVAPYAFITELSRTIPGIISQLVIIPIVLNFSKK